MFACLCRCDTLTFRAATLLTSTYVCVLAPVCYPGLPATDLAGSIFVTRPKICDGYYPSTEGTPLQPPLLPILHLYTTITTPAAYDVRQVNTINIDLTSSHTGCAKMLQDLDLSDDRDNYNSHGGNGGDTNGAGKAGGGGAARSDIKGMDDRTESVGLGGGAAAKGGDEGRRRGREEDDDLDDLLDLMDSTAESK